MKFARIFSALALAIIMASTAAAQQPQQEGGPKLAIESFTHDFGEVKAGTPLRYTFKIKNEGKSDLLIQNVAPS